MASELQRPAIEPRSRSGPFWVRRDWPPRRSPRPRTSSAETRIASLARSPTSASVSLCRAHRCRCRRTQAGRPGLFRIALMISKGVAFGLSMPIAAIASGVSVTSFFRTRNDHRAGRERLTVIILPAGARKREHSLALGKGEIDIRSGSMKMSRCRRRRSAGSFPKAACRCRRRRPHVADAGDGEGRRLDVDVHFAEVPLDGLPRAARGDSHLLCGRSRRSRLKRRRRPARSPLPGRAHSPLSEKVAVPLSAATTK